MADQQPEETEQISERTMNTRLGAAEALRTLSKVEWPKIQTSVNLLLQLFRNIEREPGNEKFQTLKMSNPKLSRDLFPVPGCMDFLHYAGFRFQGFEGDVASLVYDKRETSLSAAWVVEELTVFMEAETAKQWRRERDERIAKAKVAESQNSRFKSSRRENALVVENSPEGLGSDEISIKIQMLTELTNIKVALKSTLGDLRASVALKAAWQPDRVKLVLMSAEGAATQLLGDHRSLEVCELADGSLLYASHTSADEFQDQMASKLDKIGQASAHESLDRLAKEISWQFTQEIIVNAETLGFLDQETAKPLKRKMHTGEMTMKEVRDQIIASAGLNDEGRSPFQHIINKHLGSNTKSGFKGKVDRICTTYSAASDNQRYALMIARDNAQGLMEASSRMHKR